MKSLRPICSSSRPPLAYLSGIALAISMGQAQAVVNHHLDGESWTVNKDDSAEQWTLINGSELSTTPGSWAYEIRATDSAVHLDGTTVRHALSTGENPLLDLTNSTATIVNSTLEGDQNAATVNLQDSQALIVGSTISNDDGVGLLLGSPNNTCPTYICSSTSVAMIIDSTISGHRGINTLPGAQVFLSGTQVRGIDDGGSYLGDGGIAATLFGGTLVAADGSSLVGDKNGVLLASEEDPDGVFDSTLVLDGSHVEGINDSAILVDSLPGFPPVDATIVLANGSTATGGNGVLLEVKGENSAHLIVDNSQVEGDVVVDEQGSAIVSLQNFATFTGQLENVEQLEVSSGAQWNMVDDAQVENVTLQGGTINLGDGSEYRTLTLGSLAGEGTFSMNTDIAAGEGDFLNVEGEATGNFQLNIKNSGAEVDDGNLQMVHTGGGDAQFEVQGGGVDLGAYQYLLVQHGNDWFLEPSEVITPSTASVLGLFSAAPSVWYGELTSLRSRMGELRSGQAGGFWTRSYSNRYKLSAAANLTYQQNQSGLSLGADGVLPTASGEWLLGLMAGTSSSNLDLKRGTSAEVESYYLGAYATWLAASGYYVDAVLKVNRFDNSSDVRMSDGTKAKGDYRNNGLGASLEAGRRFQLDEGWFIEPNAQVAALWVNGNDYHLDNGMQARSNHANSLQGKLGMNLGKRIELASGGSVSPFAKLAVAHEFADNNRVQVNDERFTNDLSGSRGEIGMGVTVDMSERLQMHLALDYGKGPNVEQPYAVNFGLRYAY